MLAIAALSARSLVECAARDGLASVALDLFGDVDTCRAALQWLPIGAAPSLRIDAEALLQALERLAARGDVRGWIAGAGFEGRSGLLAQGAARLPLIGTQADDVRRLRDPRDFFDALDAQGIAHPEVAFASPASAAGWLRKDAGGCGGCQVQRAADTAGLAPQPGHYWQRERLGRAMSATFIANGSDAVLLGINAQIQRPIGAHPFVFSGVVGPLPVADAVQRDIGAAAQRVAGRYHLRGLGSIDFVQDGDHAEVLEVNPRPTASALLYPRVGAAGPLQAHLRACLHGELPPAPAPQQPVRGFETLFARRAMTLGARGAARLAALPDVHDLPHEGARFADGAPLCSVSASGRDAEQVRVTLAARRDSLLQELEDLS